MLVAMDISSSPFCGISLHVCRLMFVSRHLLYAFHCFITYWTITNISNTHQKWIHFYCFWFSATLFSFINNACIHGGGKTLVSVFITRSLSLFLSPPPPKTQTQRMCDRNNAAKHWNAIRVHQTIKIKDLLAFPVDLARGGEKNSISRWHSGRRSSAVLCGWMGE